MVGEKDSDGPMARGFIGNPLPWAIVMKLAGWGARVIIEMGIVQKLQDKAAETSNPVDDFLLSTLASALQKLAQL